LKACKQSGIGTSEGDHGKTLQERGVRKECVLAQPRLWFKRGAAFPTVCEKKAHSQKKKPKDRKEKKFGTVPQGGPEKDVQRDANLKKKKEPLKTFGSVGDPGDFKICC